MAVSTNKATGKWVSIFAETLAGAGDPATVPEGPDCCLRTAAFTTTQRAMPDPILQYQEVEEIRLNAKLQTVADEAQRHHSIKP
jgi:hypothetical protein